MSEKAIPPPTTEVIERVRSEYGLNEKSIKDAVAVIKAWLKSQPHLPEEQNDGKLERWLLRCENNIEKTKETLDLYYTLKTKTPELMSNWDVKSEWFENICSLVHSFPAPKLTPEYDRVLFFGYLPKEASGFSAKSHFSLNLMVAELRITEDYNLSDIFVYDMANFSLAHVPKMEVALMKIYETCLMKGYNTRMKALHIINVPQVGEYLINIIKTLLSPLFATRVFVHGTDMTSLHKYIPKDVLPSDYGGDCGSVEEQWGKFRLKLDSYRDFFLEQQELKSDESKRVGGGGGMPSVEVLGLKVF